MLTTRERIEECAAFELNQRIFIAFQIVYMDGVDDRRNKNIPHL